MFESGVRHGSFSFRMLTGFFCGLTRDTRSSLLLKHCNLLSSVFSYPSSLLNSDSLVETLMGGPLGPSFNHANCSSLTAPFKGTQRRAWEEARWYWEKWHASLLRIYGAVIWWPRLTMAADIPQHCSSVTLPEIPFLSSQLNSCFAALC